MARRPSASSSQIASQAGIDQRTVHRALRELEDAGYITRAGKGRAMRLTVHLEKTVDPRFRTSVGDLLSALGVAAPSSLAAGDTPSAGADCDGVTA